MQNIKEREHLSGTWTFRDYSGAALVRLGFNRSGYTVEPGIHLLGKPDESSPVLVTANYKLSFDLLRKGAAGMNAWILVLDTSGINVWCAAGKGSFGTEALVDAIEKTDLPALISHRELVLPQLGAVGVSAHKVKKLTGFTLRYGPVRAKDIPRYFENGKKKDLKMSTVSFGFWDRLTLVPVEIRGARYGMAGLLVFTLLLSFVKNGFPGIFQGWPSLAIPFFGAAAVGTIAVPLLLPLLPFRSFALKGAVAGLLWSAGYAVLTGSSVTEAAGIVLACTAVTSFLAMNFTGAAAYTSQTGAEIEVRKGIPVMIAGAVTGIILLIAGILLKK